MTIIDTRYCKLEYQARDRELLTDNNKMSNQELLHLCKDYDICPSLISINDVNDVFLSAIRSGTSVNQDEEDEMLQRHWQIGFAQFLECLARFALIIKMEGTQWDTVQKVKLLLDKLDLKNVVRLASSLQRVDSFSILVPSPPKNK